MKGENLFLRVSAAFGFKRKAKPPVNRQYPDPVVPERLGRRLLPKARPARKQGRKRLGYPPFQPGTVVYFDRLVAKFGRREADRIMYAYIDGDLTALPNIEDLK